MPDPVLGKDFYFKVLPHPALSKTDAAEAIAKNDDSDLLMNAILIDAGIMAPYKGHDRQWAIGFMKSH